MIVSDLSNVDNMVGGIETSQEVMGWSIKDLFDEAKKESVADWHRAAAGQPWVGQGSSQEDIKREAQSTLTAVLDKFATQIRVTALSKRL